MQLISHFELLCCTSSPTFGVIRLLNVCQYDMCIVLYHHGINLYSFFNMKSNSFSYAYWLLIFTCSKWLFQCFPHSYTELPFPPSFVCMYSLYILNESFFSLKKKLFLAATLVLWDLNSLKVKVIQSCLTLCNSPWNSIQSMEFSRPEYWSG